VDSQLLSVAGFTIKVNSERNEAISFEEGYVPFFIHDSSVKPDIIVKAVNGIPDKLLHKDRLLFDARNQDQDFFSIHQMDNSYKFIITEQKENGRIQQVALLNHELTEWIVYCNPEINGKTCPLLYPLGPIMLYYLTVKSDAIMLHASGVLKESKGYIFSGFSGAGKSTMAGLWQETGSKIVNDDRLIIRKTKKGYSIYNTPMFYADIPKEAPLNSISLIHHSPENTIKKISGAKAVSRILANCIQHGYDNTFIEHHLEFLSGLCGRIPVYEVGFKPEAEVVDFIIEHAD
jgi:hypothetical protein